jgi:sec-independent protein translocase protein TatC
MPFKKDPRPALKGPDDRMTLRDHLAELRVRIVRCMLAVVLGICIMLAFYNQILRFLVHPYTRVCTEEGKLTCDGLVNLGPLDAFGTRISVTLYGGLILAFPVVIWQIWRFIVPGLHAKEKKVAIPFLASTISLFILGSYTAYWTMDKAIKFLISWSGSGIKSSFQVSKYISFLSLMVVAYGIGFEFPVLLVFLQIVGVVTPRALLKQWRYAIMAIFVIVAIITPSGDPISMCALAIPMSLFYMLAIAVGFLLARRKRARGDGDDDDDGDDAAEPMATASA